MNYLIFTPIYQERVWGGRAFESTLGRTLPAEQVIGESWEVVDRPEAQSVVAAGLQKGKTLRQLISEDSKNIMGPTWDPNKPFPILIKWLDAQDRLSLQVHPPKEVAKELGGEPKRKSGILPEPLKTPQCLPG